MKIRLPYGHSFLTANLPDRFVVDIIKPPMVPAAEDPRQVVKNSLDPLTGGLTWSPFAGSKSVGIAINDKTRPVPHHHLLPPLLEILERLGIPDKVITFFIAAGTHPPMSKSEFSVVVPESILQRYRVVTHDAENDEILENLGETSLGTPVWTNSRYYRSELKIVVGNIAPHQFMGFSGGVKTAAIGLAGLKTIRYNHAFMTHPDAHLGVYDRNPARQDVEEIGKKLGIHLALNAILNQDKRIVYALSGDPQDVMVEGISLARRICQVEVPGKYDLMIASPGGHPKDINVYQSQKGIFHAAQVTRPGGTMILTAACPEGSGSTHYEEWVTGKSSHADVLNEFKAAGFRMGPHKAFLIARDATNLRLLFYSAMDNRTVKNLLLNPVDDFQTAVDQAIAALKPGARVGIMPYASSTIPFVTQDRQENRER